MATIISEAAKRLGIEEPRAARRSRRRANAVRLVIRTFALAWAASLAVFLVMVRFKPRPLLFVVRSFNKRLLNPAMLRLAGSRFWYASTVQHVGRRSGQEYVTPVVAEPSDGGFVIPLPYGTDVDWLKNVLVSGKCAIQYRGQEFNCGKPEILGIDEASTLVPPRMQRTWRFLGISQVLSLKQTATSPAHDSPTY